MTDQEKLNFKEKYQNNPVAFCEDIMNVKLLPYQKEMLNIFYNNKNRFISFIGGRINQKLWLSNMQLEYMKAMEMNFQVWKSEGIDVYEKGVLVNTIKDKEQYK